MKGQLSIEMLIVLALILGLVFIVYTQLNKAGAAASQKIERDTATILGDQLCREDRDCPDGLRCDTSAGRCSGAPAP